MKFRVIYRLGVFAETGQHEIDLAAQGAAKIPDAHGTAMRQRERQVRGHDQDAWQFAKARARVKRLGDVALSEGR